MRRRQDRCALDAWLRFRGGFAVLLRFGHRKPGCFSMAFWESAMARSIFLRVLSESSSDDMAFRTSFCRSPSILPSCASQMAWTLVLFLGGMFFFDRPSQKDSLSRGALRRLLENFEENLSSAVL